MAACIVCEEREGTAGFGDCCTTVCQQMTQAHIQRRMSSHDTILKGRQATARAAYLTASLNRIVGVPPSLVAELQETALKDDRRGP